MFDQVVGKLKFVMNLISFEDLLVTNTFRTQNISLKLLIKLSCVQSDKYPVTEEF